MYIEKVQLMKNGGKKKIAFIILFSVDEVDAIFALFIICIIYYYFNKFIIYFDKRDTIGLRFLRQFYCY